ncbi:DNA repair protein RadC [Paenibacillus sp. JGP012]|uniref:RadC family protein n=1 Tax=Paenibacillus sp. JGP012 TaxID=2735914 RepID=UPI0017D3EF57|nr:DNA repair protein RadC [Paenibacillus sp. JGP012]MBB6019063.1 DNA repair protein RadC [Paenibacillus sp. JGP012]
MKNISYNEELKKLISVCLSVNQDSIPIEQLFKQYPTTTALMNISEQQLVNIKGIGLSKARQLNAILKLAKLLTLPVSEQISIRSPKDIFHFLEPEFKFLKKEHFVCLFLNTKNKVICKEVISIGSLNATIVHPREVFHAAIKHCSASIVCAHNHPSGDSTPSPEDVNLTKRLVEAGETIGIDVLDHIIIGHNSYTSLREKNLM